MVESVKAKVVQGTEEAKVAPSPPGDIRRRVDKKLPTGPFVKYVGQASVRTINPSEWKSLGISLTDDSVTSAWNIKNDFLIPVNEFSDEQLDYLLVDDMQQSGGHSFVSVDYDKNGGLEQVEV